MKRGEVMNKKYNVRLQFTTVNSDVQVCHVNITPRTHDDLRNKDVFDYIQEHRFIEADSECTFVDTTQIVDFAYQQELDVDDLLKKTE